MFIKRLADVNEKVLEKLLEGFVKYMRKNYETW